jgi:GNAT superfamily N-acetyltransferase
LLDSQEGESSAQDFMLYAIVLLNKFITYKQTMTFMNGEKDSIVIQQVDGEIFEDFLGLIDKLAEYEKLAPPNEEARRRLRIDCLSDKPKFYALIGKIGSKCVSYIIYFFTYSSFLGLPILYLEDIFVLEEYRRQGIGKVMLEHLKEIAKLEGCCRIEFTVLKWNKSAQEFYEKSKAKRVEWFFYRLVKEDFC